MSNGTIVINRQQASKFHGSDLWWENSDTNAIKSIKNGKGKHIDNLREAMKYLHT